MASYWLIFIAICFLKAAEATPQCRLLGEEQKDLVCTAGDTDYMLRRGLVSDNNRTTGITLRNCRITDVDYESFEDVPLLKYMDLSQNSIKYLKLGVLDGNRLVTYLNLSHNLLTNFPMGLFDEKSNLEVLDLKSNVINSLELGIFDPLTKLSHLDLSDNKLVGGELSPYIFDKSLKIKFMDFSRNDMSQSKDNLLHSFTMIELLNLDRCQLAEVPNFATRSNLKTMKHLILSTNFIRELNDPTLFMNLDNLEIIDFSENSIQNINENIFKSLKKLKMVKLRNNKIVVVPDAIFQNLPKVTTIDLSYNSIENIPPDVFRGTSLKTLNLSHNRLTFLQDNFCLELKNSGAVLIKFYFNHNPWQCACLKDILNEVKSLNIRYNSFEYNGNTPTCVFGSENICKRQLEFNIQFAEKYDRAKSL